MVGRNLFSVFKSIFCIDKEFCLVLIFLENFFELGYFCVSVYGYCFFIIVFDNFWNIGVCFIFVVVFLFELVYRVSFKVEEWREIRRRFYIEVNILVLYLS